MLGSSCNYSKDDSYVLLTYKGLVDETNLIPVAYLRHSKNENNSIGSFHLCNQTLSNFAFVKVTDHYQDFCVELQRSNIVLCE